MYTFWGIDLWLYPKGFNLDSAVELVGRMVINGVIGVENNS